MGLFVQNCGWSGAAKVLGKLSVPGVLLSWSVVGQGHTALAVGAGGVIWSFFLSSIFFRSPSLWETAQYILKYCLEGLLNPKQPTKYFKNF